MDTLKNYISTQQAATRYGLAQDYFSLLASRGTIKGVKIARNWLLYVPSLEEYMRSRPKRGPKPRKQKQT